VISKLVQIELVSSPISTTINSTTKRSVRWVSARIIARYPRHDDPIRAAFAHKIIALAQTGERDPRMSVWGDRAMSC
jgi:hypothetical protein